MTKKSKSIDNILGNLLERAKELSCIYELEEILKTPGLNVNDTAAQIAGIVPPAMKYPDICHVRISLQEEYITGKKIKDTPWMISQKIKVQEQVVGQIDIIYSEEKPPADHGPFLKEERRLLDTIAQRFGDHIMYQNLRDVFTWPHQVVASS